MRTAAYMLMFALGLGNAGTAAQVVPREQGGAAVLAPPMEFGNRLKALDPARPRMYLELAEEMAAEDRTPRGRDTARHLYVLAVLLPRKVVPATPAAPAELWAEADAPVWLASSACLGLAVLAEKEQDRRWLTALAATLAPVDAMPAPVLHAEAAMRDAAALNLATALGLARTGEGRRAIRLLENPAVGALLSRYEGVLNPGGLSGGGDRIRSLANRFGPCLQCHNRRYVKDADGVHLCPTCQGRPGPKISVPEMIGQLRLESLLLNGIQRSWAAQTVADGGAPMRELDASVLADVYGVDVTKAYWREGVWVGAEGASADTTSVPSVPGR